MKNQIKMILATLLVTATTSAAAIAPMVFELSRESVDIANVTRHPTVDTCFKSLETRYGLMTHIQSIKALENEVYFYDVMLLEGGDIVAGDAIIKVARNHKAFPEFGPSYVCNVIELKTY